MKLDIDNPLNRASWLQAEPKPRAKDSATPCGTCYSTEASSRQVSTLKKTAASVPANAISLAVGRPRWDLYPWLSKFRYNGKAPRLDMLSDASPACEEDGASDLVESLGYGTAAGLPKLVNFFAEHMRRVHDPASKDWECCITCGTTSALEILLRMFCDRADTVLTEEYTYTGFIEATKPMGLRIHGVAMDEEGLVPEILDTTMSGWDPKDGPRPYLLYTIPTGQNPTGVTQSANRRREIYEIAEKHDLLIVEDDPYYFLNLDFRKENSTSPEAVRREFLNSLPPSYLSLDTTGRVIRLDSTSKILAPGLRVGWLTASSEICQKFQASSEFTVSSPSGVAQLLTYRLLAEQWGHEGLVEWLIWLSGQYRARRAAMLEACERHLPEKLCSWVVPGVGMFLWISVDLKNTSVTHFQQRDYVDVVNVDALEDAIWNHARGEGVLVSKGTWFDANPERLCSGCNTVVRIRLTFAAAVTEDMDESVRRLAIAIKRTRIF